MDLEARTFRQHLFLKCGTNFEPEEGENFSVSASFASMLKKENQLHPFMMIKNEKTQQKREICTLVKVLPVSLLLWDRKKLQR